MTSVVEPETPPRERDPAGPRLPERAITRRVGLPNGRAVVGGLLMVVAALGVFVAYRSANRAETVGLYVAAHDLAPGERLDESDLTIVEIDPRGAGLGAYQPGGPLVGQYVNRPIRTGELLVDAVVTPADDWEPDAEITLSVPEAYALGGELRVGERVDVYVTWNRDRTQRIAADATVLDLRASGGGTLGGGNQTVTVRLALVDAEPIDALVHAQAEAKITFVRATGAEPGAVFERPDDGG